MQHTINLFLVVETAALRVTVVNTSAQALRLWSRDNAWGWFMFSLLVARPGSDQWAELSAKAVRWTATIPHAVSLAPGAQLDYVLRPADPAWEQPNAIQDWLNQPLYVRVRLCVIETPEAIAQAVWIGEVRSSPVLSTPPHAWLNGSRSTTAPRSA